MTSKRGPESGLSPAPKKMDFDVRGSDGIKVLEDDGDGVSSQSVVSLYSQEDVFNHDLGLSQLSIDKPISIDEAIVIDVNELSVIGGERLSQLSSLPSLCALDSSLPSVGTSESQEEVLVERAVFSDNVDDVEAGTPLLLCDDIDVFDCFSDGKVSDSGTSEIDQLNKALAAVKDAIGSKCVAETILGHADLREEIMSSIIRNAHLQLKNSLPKSILKIDRSNREYLLSLTPEKICKELRDSSPDVFSILVGLLGIRDTSTIMEKQTILNVLALIHSTISKVVNEKACGFALAQASNARDGGMREDSIKLCANYVHPRTIQKYEKYVLAKDWNAKLVDARNIEAAGFSL